MRSFPRLSVLGFMIYIQNTTKKSVFFEPEAGMLCTRKKKYAFVQHS